MSVQRPLRDRGPRRAPVSRFGASGLSLATLSLSVLLAGCGTASGGSSQPTTPRTATTAATTATTYKPAPPHTVIPAGGQVKLRLRSPVSLTPIAARYTCDGSNTSLPFTWQNVPANTKEIDLFVFSLTLIHNSQIAWAVAGLKPTSRGVSEGHLPPGAIVGDNAFGQQRYSICPPHGTQDHYIVRVIALPHRIPVKPGFNAEALGAHALGTTGPTGLLGFSYVRN